MVVVADSSTAVSVVVYNAEEPTASRHLNFHVSVDRITVNSFATSNTMSQSFTYHVLGLVTMLQHRIASAEGGDHNTASYPSFYSFDIIYTRSLPMTAITYRSAGDE